MISRCINIIIIINIFQGFLHFASHSRDVSTFWIMNWILNPAPEVHSQSQCTFLLFKMSTYTVMTLNQRSEARRGRLVCSVVMPVNRSWSNRGGITILDRPSSQTSETIQGSWYQKVLTLNISQTRTFIWFFFLLKWN